MRVERGGAARAEQAFDQGSEENGVGVMNQTPPGPLTLEQPTAEPTQHPGEAQRDQT